MSLGGRGNHFTGSLPLGALCVVGMLMGAAPPLTQQPRLNPVPVAGSRHRNPKLVPRPLNQEFCGDAADCNDRDSCTDDACVDQHCVNTPVPDCVACRPTFTCPATDVVFVMDTSGSMKDEGAALCTTIGAILTELRTLGVDVEATLLGITEAPGSVFACLTDNVVSLLGATVPGNAASCPFPNEVSSFESWGPATAIVADRFPWRDGAARMVMPISDEGPCNGSRPDGCNDPGNDRDSITNAANVAFFAGVAVSPITGTGADSCIRTLAVDLAAITGGVAFFTQDAGEQLPLAVVNAVLTVCVADPRCDDGRDCTRGDLCVKGRCLGEFAPGCQTCTANAECNDGSPCTNDACVRFACANTPNYDENVSCCDPRDGSLDPIDDGDDCTQDLCNPFNGEVEHNPLPPGTVCGDATYTECDLPDTCDAGGTCRPNLAPAGAACGNQGVSDCTLADQCDGQGVCLSRHAPDGVPCTIGRFCTVGETCLSGDCQGGVVRDCSFFTDQCRLGVCNEGLGACERTPRPEGIVCDDDNPCSLADACDGEGGCRGTSISTRSCSSDAECAPGLCDFSSGSGECICGSEVTQLCLEAVPGQLPLATCYTDSDVLTVNVLLKPGVELIAGGQFLIPFDPTKLDVLDVVPGAMVEADNPFEIELRELVDRAHGRLFYAVGIGLDKRATAGPAIMAAIRFRILVGCATIGSLCLESDHPEKSVLTDVDGHPVPFKPCCTEPIRLDSDVPRLTCPSSVEVVAEAGGVTARVTWPIVSATDGCDATPQLICSATHSLGANINNLIPVGGRFPTGLSSFDCRATDDCGHEGSCRWSVQVDQLNAVQMSIELSPAVTPGPLQRCIEFDFYPTSCAGTPVSVSETIEFGLPFNLPGRADYLNVKIPAGRYSCVTARDPLHSLRSTSSLVISGGAYQATFEGDPSLGGNWLVGGNLNGDGVIDLLDVEVFDAKRDTTEPADTPCGTAGPHGDINGDGRVNSLDLSFINNHFGRSDAAGCCEVGSTAVAEGPLLDVAVGDLQSLGLDTLATLDFNRDGRLALIDLAMWWQSLFSQGK